MASRKLLFKKSFNPEKCKTSLKLTTSRIRLLRNKRQEKLRVYKRNLAQLLQSGDELTAKTRVEHVFREENTVEAYDLIESYCEQIVARFPIIESQKKCPLDLEEAISSIVFAAPRCADLVELTDIRNHFSGKYGKNFISGAVELRAGCCVNRTVIDKLSVKMPDGATKLKILAAIAKEHNVDWDPCAVEEQVLDIPEEKLAGPTGFTSATSLIPELPNVPRHTPAPQVMDSAIGGNSQTHKNDQNSQFLMNDPTFDVSKVDASSQAVSTTTNVTNLPDPATSKINLSTQGHIITSRGEQEHVPLERSSWSMHFKDAISAANEAAESAERASIAARAAAELSNLERMSRQNSAESRESPQGSTGHDSLRSPFSKTSDSFSEAPVKNDHFPKSFRGTEATSKRQGGVCHEPDNPQLIEKRGRANGGHVSRSNRSGSSWSAISSSSDLSAVTSTHGIHVHSPGHCHGRKSSKKQSQYEASENHGEGSTEKESMVMCFNESLSNDPETRSDRKKDSSGHSSASPERKVASRDWHKTESRSGSEDFDGEITAVRSLRSNFSDASTGNPLNIVFDTTNSHSSILPGDVHGNSGRGNSEPASADDFPEFDTDEENDSLVPFPKMSEMEATVNKSKLFPKSFHAPQTNSVRQGRVCLEPDNSQLMERRGCADGGQVSRSTSSGSAWSSIPFDEDVPTIAITHGMHAHSPQRRSSKQKSRYDASEKLNHGEGSTEKESMVSRFSESVLNDYVTRTVVKMKRTGRSPTNPSEKEVASGDWHKTESIREREDPDGEKTDVMCPRSDFGGSHTGKQSSIVFGTTNSHSSLFAGDVGHGNSGREISKLASDVDFPQFDTDEETEGLVKDESVESKFNTYLHAGELSSTSSWKSRESGIETTKNITSIKSSLSLQSNANIKFPDATFESSPAFSNKDASSEEETNKFVPVMGIRSRLRPAAHNVSSDRVGPPSSGSAVHVSIESSHRSRSEEGSLNNKLTELDDPECESDSDDSSVYNITRENHSLGGKSFLPRSLRTAKGQQSHALPEQFDYLDQVSIVTDTGGPDRSVDSESEGFSSLNFEFGKFGGLRNRGYTRPPYVRNSSNTPSHNNDSQGGAKHYGTDVTSGSFNQHQKVSKWVKTAIPRPSDDNLDSDVSESNEFLGNGCQRKIEQDTGPYSPRVSGDEWRASINQSHREVSTSFGTDIHIKGRFSGPDSVSKGRGTGEPETLVDVSRSRKPSRFKAFEVQTASEQSAYELGAEQEITLFDHDSDSDGSIDARVTLKSGDSIKHGRQGYSSKQNLSSEVFEKSKSVALNGIAETTEPCEFKAELRSYRGDNPSRLNPAPEMQTYSNRGTSHGSISSDNDEFSVNRIIRNPKENTRMVGNPKENIRLRCSVRTQNHAMPFKASDANSHGDLWDGPINASPSLDYVTEETVPTKSCPVTPGSEIDSVRIKNVKQSGSEITKEALKPSYSKTMPAEPQKVEPRTPRTPYNPAVSHNEYTDARKEIHLNMVAEGSKFRTAPRHVLTPQSSGGVDARFNGDPKVKDAYTDGGSRPTERRITSEQAKNVHKDAIATESRTADTKKTKPVDTKKTKPVDTKKTSASVETVSPLAPHVHPKLPDYDSILAQFGRRQSR